MTNAAIQLDRAIQQAASQYYRLVVVAGMPGVGKTAALQATAQKYGCPVINVNLELSKRMLELPRVQRSYQVDRFFKDQISTTPGDLVFLDNLEILFDTSLEIDPLRLLRSVSRNRTIVASWNGTYQDNALTYAEPGHPEFFQTRQPEAIVISLGTNVPQATKAH